MLLLTCTKQNISPETEESIVHVSVSGHWAFRIKDMFSEQGFLGDLLCFLLDEFSHETSHIVFFYKMMY